MALVLTFSLFGENKTTIFDFSDPLLVGTAVGKLESQGIEIEFIKHENNSQAPTITQQSDEVYVKVRKSDQISIAAKSENQFIIAVNVYKGYRPNVQWGMFDFIIIGSNESIIINQNPSEDGYYFSLSSGNNIIEAQATCFIKKIEVEYSIEEPEQPEVPVIKDMPTDVLKTEFSDFDGTVGEQTDYVFVAGNVVATGNLLENGHLEVVRFADGVKSFPVDYAFRFKELYDGEFVIQNKRNEYLSAGENGHFALTTSDEEALLWNVSVDGSKVEISKSSNARAAGQSIMFSESAGGFGLYDAGGEATAPTVYAYTSPTTAIAELVENDEAEAVYYDLRGNVVDIERCSPGIYICRKGIKVTKVAIK